MDSIARRAAVHAALGEPVRLAIVEDLAVSDRSPTELATRCSVPSNLLAHHLDVLEDVGLIERFVSAGDRRRRYVRLVREPLARLGVATARPAGQVLFVCSHNSARSQLAAALWTARTGGPASSAGTHPADRVHPGAVAAASRAGLDLSEATPRMLGAGDDAAEVVDTGRTRRHRLRPGPRGTRTRTGLVALVAAGPRPGRAGGGVRRRDHRTRRPHSRGCELTRTPKEEPR
jgi:ArsR family transcriptional regulator, arsenate/arsenite/antimonite-responsive transcriptional repressor / arsenate reductase (thioredoxin)